MTAEILTVAEMYEADRYAAGHGTPSLTLMENAGRAAADAIERHWTPCVTTDLCGPGNNGGDGFVVARTLKQRGWDVRLALLGSPDALKGDAADMARRWDGPVLAIAPGVLEDTDLIVDAMFGAGLARPLEGAAKQIVEALNGSDIAVAAIDVPSGLDGDLARPLEGACIEADLTITFFRKKP